MKIPITTKFSLVVLVVLLFSNTLMASVSAIKRYAVIAAANNGGAERVSLRYAETDALSIAKVLQELGGLESGNRLLLLEPSPDEIIEAFERIQKRIDEDDSSYKRTELFFYYSGHSDDRGLLLGEKRLDYGRLKKALVNVTADVQIAVLDSCASGAFTRIKGGKHKPPFMVDESSHVQGYAFLASSSASENAQESDAIGGAYFTHYFVSALRGAGDTSLDKKITLNEAYQYAFHETLARTEQSLNGAQHAAYDFRLAGAGELVLTDLNKAIARIQLDKALGGRLYIRDQAGRLIVELNKTPGIMMEVSLAPQTYLITLDKQGVLFKAAFTVSRKKINVLRFAQFHRIDPVRTSIRGSSKTSDIGENGNIKDILKEKFRNRRGILENINKIIPVKVSLAPGISIPRKEKESDEYVEVDLQIFGGDTDNAKISAGYIAAVAQENVSVAQGAGIVSYVGKDLYGGQGAGFVSITRGNLYGGQGAGAVSITSGNLMGGQGAGGVAITKGDLSGGQGAGIAAITRGNLVGGQGAGVISITSGDLKGGQGAGLINIVGGNIHGPQISILANISGGFNNGIQIGALNISEHVKYLQLGILNFAKKNDGIALGLINVIGNGRFDIGASHDESNYANLVIKSGAQQYYNQLSIGEKQKSNEQYMRIRWGMGITQTLRRGFSIDYDLLAGVRLLKGDSLLKCNTCAHYSPIITLQSSLSYELISEFKMIAEVSLNALQKHAKDKSENERYFGREAGQVWPGFSLGVLFSL